jgi:hypothetical protein
VQRVDLDDQHDVRHAATVSPDGRCHCPATNASTTAILQIGRTNEALLPPFEQSGPSVRRARTSAITLVDHGAASTA